MTFNIPNDITISGKGLQLIAVYMYMYMLCQNIKITKGDLLKFEKFEAPKTHWYYILPNLISIFSVMSVKLKKYKIMLIKIHLHFNKNV